MYEAPNPSDLIAYAISKIAAISQESVIASSERLEQTLGHDGILAELRELMLSMAESSDASLKDVPSCYDRDAFIALQTG